jgi:hypothetical protein
MAVGLVTAGPAVVVAVGVAAAAGVGVAVGVGVATRLAIGVGIMAMEACGVQDVPGMGGIHVDGETVGGLELAGLGVAAARVGVAAWAGVAARVGRGVSRSMDTV